MKAKVLVTVCDLPRGVGCGDSVCELLRNQGHTADHSFPTNQVLEKVYAERIRQEHLKSAGRFAYTCADSEMTNPEKLAVLAEEFGEVAHEVNEAIGPGRKLDSEKLKAELIQTAAVCVAWAESIP